MGDMEAIILVVLLINTLRIGVSEGKPTLTNLMSEITSRGPR